jgi:heme exporter protein A
MSSLEDVVSATGVGKRFGPQRVVNSLSFSCGPGEVLLLLGANGAGKSTLLRIVAGLVRADSGEVSLSRNCRVGFAAHNTFLYSKLSVIENIHLYAKLLGVSLEECGALVDRWKLSGVLQNTVSQLSKGTQAKVSLVRALLGAPQLLLLDEPSSNLDESSVDTLLGEIHGQRSRGACIVATHDIARLKGVATRVMVLEQGACVADSGSHASEAQREEVFGRYYERNR